jgi:cell division septum initiation protein DivIVA
MLRIEDAVERAFTKADLREGYEIAEVDQFCLDVVEAITLRDRVISELQRQLAQARMHLVDAGIERGHPDGNRRESSVAAARLLEMAAVTADQLVADAKAEAGSLMSTADAEAGQLIRASRCEAERVTADLAQGREQQAAELDHHRITVLAEVADREAALRAKVETLRRLEREHRNRLRCHFAEQLAQLEDDEDDSPAVLRAVVAD